MARAWIEALLAAGVTPATFVPDASLGRFDQEPTERAAADVLEDAELTTHAVADAAAPPATVAFLDGIQQWRVVGYDGVVPIVRAYVAAAVRRRGADRRLRTTIEDAREFAVAPLSSLGREQRAALEAHVDVVDLPDLPPSQPGPVLEAARHVVVVVTGAEKARTVAAVLSGREDPQRLPAQLVRPSSRVRWLIDRAAAGDLLRDARPVSQ